jgi:hypothetical protein
MGAENLTPSRIRSIQNYFMPDMTVALDVVIVVVVVVVVTAAAIVAVVAAAASVPLWIL